MSHMISYRAFAIRARSVRALERRSLRVVWVSSEYVSMVYPLSI